MLFDKSQPANLNPAQSSYLWTRVRMAPFIAILFLIAVFASGCVIHDRGHRGRGHYSSPVVVQPHVDVAVPAPITFTFTDHHRHAAHNYYHDHYRHHGKKHKWKKRWRHKRKSHLHRDTQIQAVPYDLVRQFPPAPHGTQYIYDSDQVLLVDRNTRVVLDFINISLAVEAPLAVAPAPVVFTFNDHHRHSVRNYYHEHPRHHGKKHKWKKKRKHKKRGRGRNHRPHGWAKHDVLPPEIEVKAIHVDLARQLPHPPHGTRYTYHDDQVLLINLRTRVVLDLINIEVGF